MPCRRSRADISADAEISASGARELPSFPILDWSVVRFIPKQAVAPEEPPMERPPVMKKACPYFSFRPA